MLNLFVMDVEKRRRVFQMVVGIGISQIIGLKEATKMVLNWHVVGHVLKKYLKKQERQILFCQYKEYL